MVEFDITGIGELEMTLEEVADLPDDVLLAMLEAGGEVIRAGQEKALHEIAYGDDSTGQLKVSIDMTHQLKRGRSGTPGITVYPRGVRSDGKTRNAEVGFILEYGAPRRGIAPRPWIRKANEASAGKAAQAAQAVFEAWLERKGL